MNLNFKFTKILMLNRNDYKYFDVITNIMKFNREYVFVFYQLIQLYLEINEDNNAIY